MCRDSSLPDEVVDLVDGTLTFVRGLFPCQMRLLMQHGHFSGIGGGQFSGSKNITNDLVSESGVTYFYAKL